MTDPNITAPTGPPLRVPVRFDPIVIYTRSVFLARDCMYTAQCHCLLRRHTPQGQAASVFLLPPPRSCRHQVSSLGGALAEPRWADFTPNLIQF